MMMHPRGDGCSTRSKKNDEFQVYIRMHENASKDRREQSNRHLQGNMRAVSHIGEEPGFVAQSMFNSTQAAVRIQVQNQLAQSRATCHKVEQFGHWSHVVELWLPIFVRHTTSWTRARPHQSSTKTRWFEVETTERSPRRHSDVLLPASWQLEDRARVKRTLLCSVRRCEKP